MQTLEVITQKCFIMFLWLRNKNSSNIFQHTAKLISQVSDCLQRLYHVIEVIRELLLVPFCLSFGNRINFKYFSDLKYIVCYAQVSLWKIGYFITNYWKLKYLKTINFFAFIKLFLECRCYLFSKYVTKHISQEEELTYFQIMEISLLSLNF